MCVSRCIHLLCFFFSFTFNPPAGWGGGGIKTFLKLAHTSTYFHVMHVVCVDLTRLYSQSSLFSGVSFGSRFSAIARAGPTGGPRYFNTAAQASVVHGCESMLTRPDPSGSGAVEIATRNGIIPGSMGLAQTHPTPTKSPAG